MIFITDNCTKETFKKNWGVRAALVKKYRRIMTDTAGTPDAPIIDRVYKAWKEDCHGVVEEYLYMHVWWSGEECKLKHQILVFHPDWVRQFMGQETGH